MTFIVFMNTLKDSLTKRQREIMDFVQSRRAELGRMPSTREIQRFFGFASQTAAVNHLKALEKKGFLRRLPGDLLPVNTDSFSSIPLLGIIPAGMPTYGDAVAEGARFTGVLRCAQEGVDEQPLTVWVAGQRP